MTSSLKAFALAVSTTLAPAVSHAAIIAQDSFDYPTGTAVGQNGGTGFTAGYTAGGGGATITPGLSYPGLLSSGNALTTNSTTAAANAGVFRDLSSTILVDSGTLFVGFTTATNGTTANYAGVSFFSSGSEELFLGKPSATPNYGISVSGGATSFSSTLASSATSLLVYRITFGATTDTIDLFVNPVPGGVLPALPDASVTTADNSFFPNPFNRIRVQSGDQGFTVDELRIGQSFAEVAPVPEPSATLALAGAAALFIGRRRRTA